VVGVAGDHRAWAGHHSSTHAENFAQLAPRAEDKLDLALAEAQGLERPRLHDRGRLQQAHRLAGLEWAGGRETRLADEAVRGLGLRHC
jgi:hypothetical protein